MTKFYTLHCPFHHSLINHWLVGKVRVDATVKIHLPVLRAFGVEHGLRLCKGQSCWLIMHSTKYTSTYAGSIREKYSVILEAELSDLRFNHKLNDHLGKMMEVEWCTDDDVLILTDVDILLSLLKWIQSIEKDGSVVCFIPSPGGKTEVLVHPKCNT